MNDTLTQLDAVCLAAQIILESGGETYRAEETAEKMCQGFGMKKADVLALPTGVTLTIQSSLGESYTRIARVHSRNTNLARIDACNAVSRQVAAGRLSAKDALEKLTSIHHTPPFSQRIMVIACALSSAFYAIMLGGKWPDFFVALLCGTATQLLLPALSKRKVPGVMSGMIASFIVTLIALICESQFPSLLIEPIISGAIMPILPGLAMTNAIRDTIRGDLVSGGARTVEAVLCAVLLAAGVGIMMAIWGGMGA